MHFFLVLFISILQATEVALSIPSSEKSQALAKKKKIDKYDRYFAPQIGIHLRFASEYNYTDDSAYNINEIQMNSNNENRSVMFKFRNAYITVDGGMYKKIKYTVMFNFQKKSFDDLFLDYKVTRRLRLRVGQFFMGSGSFERLDHLLNVPFYTMANDEEFGLARKEGAAITYKIFSYNKILLSVSNGEKERNSMNPMYGFVWDGQYLNRRIETMFSYHYYDRPKQVNSPTNVENSVGGIDQYLAFGLRMSTLEKGLGAEIGSMYNFYGKKSGDLDDNIISSYAQLIGNLDKFKFIIKAEYSRYTQGRIDLNIRKGGSFGIDYYPKINHLFRYFVQYYQSQDYFWGSKEPTLYTGARIKGTGVITKKIELGVVLDI